jgi:transcriptional antiterminator NusG
MRTLTGGEDEPERLPLQPGQVVKIVEGPFTGFEGTIERISHDSGKVRIRVHFYGRETPLELEQRQLEPLA